MNKKSDLTERFCRLIDVIADGSQRKFAAVIGCSPSVVAKIVRGEQEPGHIILQRIKNNQSINWEWLLTGKGNPVHYLPSETKYLVPLAKALLPGPPSEFKGFLTAKSIVVPESIHRDSLYAIHARDCNYSHTQSENILPEDLICIDTAEIAWHSNIQILDGALCVIGSTPTQMKQLSLVRVQITDHQLRVIDIDSSEPKENRKSLQGYKENLRSIILDDNENKNRSDCNEIDLSDVVGYAIHLYREL